MNARARARPSPPGDGDFVSRCVGVTSDNRARSRRSVITSNA